MSKLTITQVRELKADAEHDILMTLRNFQKATNLSIEALGITSERLAITRGTRIVVLNVNIEAQI